VQTGRFDIPRCIFDVGQSHALCPYSNAMRGNVSVRLVFADLSKSRRLLPRCVCLRPANRDPKIRVRPPRRDPELSHHANGSRTKTQPPENDLLTSSRLDSSSEVSRGPIANTRMAAG
jgi:hypothetical protein